jgi:hypothetical protein
MTDIVVKNGLIDHAAFERLLMSLLPDVVAEIDDDERSLLHMEMSAVARATCRAIENSDANSIRRHFEFIENVLSNAAPDIENAVHVSYLENVFLGEERAAFLRARSALPPRYLRTPQPKLPEGISIMEQFKLITDHMVKYIEGPPARVTGAVNMIRPDGTQPAPELLTMDRGILPS